MKKIVKILIVMSLFKGYNSYAITEEFRPEPKVEQKVEPKAADKNWWSSFTDRFSAKKPSEQPTPKMKPEPASEESNPKHTSSDSSVDFSQGPDTPKSSPDVAHDDSKKAQKPSTKKEPSVKPTADGFDQFDDEESFSSDDKKSSGKKTKKQAAASDDSEGQNFDEEVKDANNEFDLMSKTKDSLFDEFKMLKSDNGIQTFKKLSEQDIRNRVKKSVDDISAKVGLNVDQEQALQVIMEDNLFGIQRKLKNKLIAQTPEEVARALFNGAEHDDRWSEFAFKDVQQRDKFEDYVMNRAETMKSSSLLEDYLRVCSRMAKKAEGAAGDAREIGEFSEGSIINKFKVGMHRTRAGLYMAANPCILAVLMLGIVGEFIYSKA